MQNAVHSRGCCDIQTAPRPNHHGLGLFYWANRAPSVSCETPLAPGPGLSQQGKIILLGFVMATAAPKPCRHSGCSALSYSSTGYCERHAHEATSEWIKAPGKSGRGGRPWRRLRDQVLKRDGYVCQCDSCQQRIMPLVAHEVDHIISLAEGGTDDPGNLMAINRDCHAKKTQAEAARGRRRSRG